MRRLATLTAAVVMTCSLLAVACSAPEAHDFGPEFQALLDDAVDSAAEIPGVAAYVAAPRLGLTWQGSAGMSDPASETEMTPEHPVRIASNTKTFVAAAVLRLVEENRLDLDAPISEHLPASFVERLIGDGYSPDDMTIRHLLTHTSGLFDHSDSENYVPAIVSDPSHRWTPTEQFEAAMDWGDPLDAPGRIFSYCDTGYILLGVILEQVTGQPLAASVRELVDFERLGLGSTWWETLEPRPAGVPDRAHQFFGDLDTHAFDPSFDLYGGGGLVSTMGDLARFFEALFNGRVYAQEETAQTMLATIDGVGARPGASQTVLPAGVYRMGVWVGETEGLTEYRHTGFFGTAVVHVPELDLTVAVTVNQNRGKQVFEDLVRQIIALVRDHA